MQCGAILGTSLTIVGVRRLDRQRPCTIFFPVSLRCLTIACSTGCSTETSVSQSVGSYRNGATMTCCLPATTQRDSSQRDEVPVEAYNASRGAMPQTERPLSENGTPPASSHADEPFGGTYSDSEPPSGLIGLSPAPLHTGIVFTHRVALIQSALQARGSASGQRRH